MMQNETENAVPVGKQKTKGFAGTNFATNTMSGGTANLLPAIVTTPITEKQLGEHVSGHSTTYLSEKIYDHSSLLQPIYVPIKHHFEAQFC